jgi:ABC-type multidrug transport system fused ATPase/permease subunit
MTAQTRGTDKKAARFEQRYVKLSVLVVGLLRPYVGSVSVGFLLIAASRILSFSVPLSTKYLVDDVIVKHNVLLLGPIVSLVLLATFLQALASFALTQVLTKSSQQMVADLRIRVQTHIARLPLKFFDNHKTGALVSRIMSDVDSVRSLVSTGLIDFLGATIAAAFALVILVRMNVVMTLIGVFVLGIVGFLISRSLKVVRPLFRQRPKIQAEVTGRLNESLNGIRVIKGYHAEERESRVFKRGVIRILENSRSTVDASASLNFTLTAILGVLTASLTLLGVRNILAGAMTLGAFMTFTMFMGMLVAPVSQLVGIGPTIAEAFAGLERTHEVLNEMRETDSPSRYLHMNPIAGLVRFENIGFSYDGDKHVLHEISFEVPAGSVAALVGPSGSGKSTLIGLIAGFYIPTRGRATVDGTDISLVTLDSYRQQLGVVLQDTFLFDGSILENVAFGQPSAGRKEIIEACRLARVDEFAERLPKEYETVVGERGVKLSGGQKQRVAIARAILANPRILILDEATSSLDSVSESLIQDALEHLMIGRTTFVIAHRLSTIRRANQIFVLDSGSIVERGTHESLCAARGAYFSLYSKQHSVEANLFLPYSNDDVSKNGLSFDSKDAHTSAEDPLVQL